jgi:hypothetical protein
MLVLLFRKDTKKILACLYQKILLVEGHILFHYMKRILSISEELI